ncbi:hypothetical protein LEN26_012019 [Aphanomyces euteiches]|nr:hypothetical protein AeMF1_010653 [Aphanomyces euteiches]KAH9118600.1 hypothetical protein LEN26_012019 [Aphanomyces euteiches]KAH9196897.1 hypothetical protein AeNC1_001151 [Aphanomyces euteiches]
MCGSHSLFCQFEQTYMSLLLVSPFYPMTQPTVDSVFDGLFQAVERTIQYQVASTIEMVNSMIGGIALDSSDESEDEEEVACLDYLNALDSQDPFDDCEVVEMASTTRQPC